MAEVQISSPAGAADPSSSSVSPHALANGVAALSQATHALVSSLTSQWQSQHIDPENPEAVFAYLIPEAQRLQTSLQQSLRSESAWTSFRELAAAEVRLILSVDLGDVVNLDERTTQLVYSFLDVVTAFQEAALVDASLSLLLIEEINERLTIDSASTVFSYLESRVSWLTRDLSPSRGKGLVLLRLLNDLLRRLSKPSRSHLVLAGRVLSLLASVFPLGERSGVNLRGEFNVGNVTKFDETAVNDAASTAEVDDEESKPMQKAGEGQDADLDKDADPAAIAARDAPFYQAFWSLQRIFANPTTLFESPQEKVDEEEKSSQGEDGMLDTRAAPLVKSEGAAPSSGNATPQRAPDGESKLERESKAEEGGLVEDELETTNQSSAPPPSPFETFRSTTRRVLDIFNEASARDQEMEQAEKAANKGGGAASKKRKREEMFKNLAGTGVQEAGKEKDSNDSLEDTNTSKHVASQTEESAFPKYLTSREIFEYQLRNPHLRRHLLLQYLIVFQYLLSFNPAQKKKAQETWKNKQLFLAYPVTAEYELSDDDEQWIRRSWKEIVGLLEETGSKAHNRNLRTTVLQMLRREGRWIQWKADNCPQIDKPGMPSSVLEAFEKGRDALLRPRPPLAHSLGTHALSELWEDGLEPIVPGKRKTENEEGFKMEVETDGLEQLELPPGIPSLAGYAKMVRQQEAKAEARRRKLGLVAADDAGDGAVSSEKAAQGETNKQELEVGDEELRLIEESKTSLNWRALRIARGTTLRLWSKIGGGDVALLLKAEKDEEEARKAAEKKKQQLGEEAAAKKALAVQRGADDKPTAEPQVTAAVHGIDCSSNAQAASVVGERSHAANDPSAAAGAAATTTTTTTVESSTEAITQVPTEDAVPVDVSNKVSTPVAPVAEESSSGDATIDRTDVDTTMADVKGADSGATTALETGENHEDAEMAEAPQ